jgi:hypothetical protein
MGQEIIGLPLKVATFFRGILVLPPLAGRIAIICPTLGSYPFARGADCDEGATRFF